MSLEKLTILLVVDAIEPCLPEWEALGYHVTTRVPEQGALDFAILTGKAGELMLQTRASLKDDLPSVSELAPSFVFYANVSSLEKARAALPGATVLVDQRKTFYGATEAWVRLSCGAVLGLSEHAG